MGFDEQRGDLGFTLADTPPDTEPEDETLTVAMIRPGGPAVRSGLEVGDVIVAIDGHDVRGARYAMAWSLMAVRPGTRLHLGLARGATVTVTAGPPL